MNCTYCSENKTGNKGKIEVLVCSNNCLNYFHTGCTTKWIRTVTPFKLPDSITEEELKNSPLIREAKKFDINSVKCPNEKCTSPICLLISDHMYFETIKNNGSLYDFIVNNYEDLFHGWQSVIRSIKNFYLNELAWRVIPDKYVRRLCRSGPNLSKGPNYQYLKLYKKTLPPGDITVHCQMQKEGRSKHYEILKMLTPDN
jgi:hypothetical protein